MIKWKQQSFRAALVLAAVASFVVSAGASLKWSY
jgi:hypothetical protein